MHAGRLFLHGIDLTPAKVIDRRRKMQERTPRCDKERSQQRRPAPGKIHHDDEYQTSRTTSDENLRSVEFDQRSVAKGMGNPRAPEHGGGRNTVRGKGRSLTSSADQSTPAGREKRSFPRENPGSSLALEKTRCEARKAGKSPESCSSDEAVLPEMEKRPQSAWNSRTGRRPRFTFSDVDKTDVDERWRTSDAPRCELTVSDSDAMMTPVQPTSDRQTGRRASQIPVSTDRLHPSTINHVHARSRRRSVCAVAGNDSTAAMLDLSRDLREENPPTPRAVEAACPKDTPGLTTSYSKNSMTEARRRALARLAGCQPLLSDPESTCRRRPPRKLDPIFYVSDDDEAVYFACR